MPSCGRMTFGAVYFLLFLLISLEWRCTAESVDVLNLLQRPQASLKDHIRAYLAGMEAALSSRSFRVGGVLLNLISPRDEDYRAGFGAAIKKTLETHPNIHFVLGPFKSSEIESARPVLRENNLVGFAPFTESVLGRYWDPHLYFTNIDNNDQLLALIRYAVGHLRVKRLGFMHLTGMKFGDEELASARARMRHMGLELSGVFTYPRKYKEVDADELFAAQFEKFANSRPQAVLMFGAPTDETERFLAQMLTDRRTSGAYILCPMASQAKMIAVSQNFTSDPQYSWVPSRIISSGMYPLANDRRYRAVEDFRTAMRDFLSTTNGSKYYSDSEYFLKNDPDGEVMMGGWIAGEVLIEALSVVGVLTDKSKFMSSLYDQRRYLIRDFVVGDYGGECDSLLEKQGIACRCNQGGTTVFLKRLTNEHRLEVMPESQFFFGAQICYTTKLTLLAPCNGVIIDLTDVEKMHYAAEVIERGLRGALGRRVSVNRDFTVKRISATVHSAATQLRDTVESEITTFVAGGVVESVVGSDNIMFVDPIFAEPRVNTFRRNVLHLAPTLEQELFVLAQFLGHEPAAEGPVRAVVRGRQASAVAEVLQRSLTTFGVAVGRVTALGADGAVGEWLPASGSVFVIGVSPDDVPVIAQRLEDSPGVRVLVPFTDMAVLYPLFVQHFAGKESAKRVVFATSFPHWGDNATNVSVVEKFHRAFPDLSSRSPLAFWGFLTAVVVQRLIENTAMLTPKSILDSVFSRSTFSIDDLVYGPYFDEVYCAMSNKAIGDCLSNFGATQISVWNLERVFSPSQQPLSSPVTPSMIYADPDSDKDRMRNAVVLAASLAALGGVVLILAAILCAVFLYYAPGRRNTNAPKNLEDPVTLIFTDIQSSTALWATCPGIMPEALETHHRLIRRLIAKYKCYEVKTIGDSFMIACKSASAAVQLVVDLQRTFLQYDWGTSAIDDAYHEFEEQQAAEDADYEPPTARLDAAVYREYWSGLRVRAGVHTGLSDIRHDEVTKRYDYYGSTSNTAARTESVAHGGQVLLTGAAYMALSTAERAGIDVTALGPVELRGVPEPVAMYQLNAVPGRAFAELRLDRECDEVDFETGTVYGSQTSGSRSDALSPAAENVLAMLQDVISPFPVQQRLKVLEPFCKRWNVDVPKVNSQRDVLAVSHLVMQRLAIKISRVIERRRAMHHGPPGSTGILSITSAGSSRHNWSRANAPIANASMTDMPSRRPQDNEGQGKSSRVLLHTHRDPLTFSLNSSIHLEVPPGIASARA